VFYYETPTSGAENAGLGPLEAVYSDLMVEVTTGHIYTQRGGITSSGRYDTRHQLGRLHADTAHHFTTKVTAP